MEIDLVKNLNHMQTVVVAEEDELAGTSPPDVSLQIMDQL